MKQRKGAIVGAADLDAGRRMMLFGLPAIGAALFAVAKHPAKPPAAIPEPNLDPRQPVYRETELVRRYYKLARF